MMTDLTSESLALIVFYLNIYIYIHIYIYDQVGDQCHQKCDIDEFEALTLKL